MSSSSEDDEDSYHEGPNQTAINGEIDFITSVIEDQLKMSGGKRSEPDFNEDETSDISDVRFLKCFKSLKTITLG